MKPYAHASSLFCPILNLFSVLICSTFHHGQYLSPLRLMSASPYCSVAGPSFQLLPSARPVLRCSILPHFFAKIELSRFESENIKGCLV
jgi:hypothetical protein